MEKWERNISESVAKWRDSGEGRPGPVPKDLWAPVRVFSPSQASASSSVQWNQV